MNWRITSTSWCTAVGAAAGEVLHHQPLPPAAHAGGNRPLQEKGQRGRGRRGARDGGHEEVEGGVDVPAARADVPNVSFLPTVY